MKKLLITALFLLPQMLLAQIDDESTPVTLSYCIHLPFKNFCALIKIR